DLGLTVAVSGDDASILGRDHYSATGAAETARRFVPFQFGEAAVGYQVLRRRRRCESSRRRGHPRRLQLQERSAVPSIFTHGALAAAGEIKFRRCRETPMPR